MIDMEIKYLNKNNIELFLNQKETTSLTKILKFVMTELEEEYFTRTGFDINETEGLIKKLENPKQRTSHNADNIIEFSSMQILNLRQNIGETLFGLNINDFNKLFEISETNLISIFELLDKLGNEHALW
ncbi:MAG: hypothetical protein ABUT20_49215 [Bacteroidota bacterium]